MDDRDIIRLEILGETWADTRVVTMTIGKFKEILIKCLSANMSLLETLKELGK